MNKVVLRPLGRNSWSGVIHYRNCFTYLAPYYTRSGSIYTGLTSEDEKRLGEDLGQDLSPLSNFWVSYFIRIGSKEIFIDTTTPRGDLDYLFLKNHKRVAASVSEIKPSHDFVLVNEDADAKIMNVYNKIKREALKEFDTMSPDERRKALRIFGYNPESSSNEVIENRLSELIDKDPQKFIQMWVENKTRDTEYLIKQAIAVTVISRNKNIYKYGQDVIGHSLEDVIAFLDNPINQEIKIAILKQLNK